MIVSMILFLIFLIDINENVDNSDGNAGGNAATTTNDTSEIEKRNKTVLDHNIDNDAIKNLNNFFPEDKKGLIYPEFPVDIINFKILPEDLEDTRIETDNVQKKIEDIINPKTTTVSRDVDSLKNTWVKSGEETSNAVLSITKNGKKIQDGVDLKYVSGCTEIVNGDTSGTGSCFDKGDIDTCHETNNCVWDIICEQPHRNEVEKDKIYTPQECIDRGGIVRTDILHAIKNKTKTSDSRNTDIYSVFDKEEGKSMYDYYISFNHGKNPSDACSLFPQDEDDGINRVSSFNSSCQNYFGTLIDLNIFSDLFSTNNDNYITEIDNGIMKKDNRYDTPSDLSEWGITQKSCLWSSRLSFEDYTRCSKENIYKNQTPADIDWNYYKDMNGKEYTYSDTTIDFNDDISSIFVTITGNIYSFFKKFNTSNNNTHIWENNMDCETWANNLDCSLVTENKNTIINNFNKVDAICCANEYSINLNEINESIKNILKVSDDWTPTNGIYTSPEINASICKVNYELITEDIDNIIKLDDLKTDKDIFTLNINLHDFNMEKMEYDTDLNDNSLINNITTTLNCGNSYISQVELKYIFILKSENNSLSLTVESRKDSLTISTKKYIIAGLSPDTPAPDTPAPDTPVPDTPVPDTPVSDNSIKLTIDIDTLLDDISKVMINTSELSFEFILKNILLLKTKDINDSLFTSKDDTKTTLKISIPVPILGDENINSRDISKKLCDMNTNIDGYYDISIPLGSGPIISGIAGSNPFYDYHNHKITVHKIFEQCEDDLIDFNGKKLLNRLYNLLKIIDKYNNKVLPQPSISCNLSEEFDKSNKGDFIKLFKENISSIPPLLEAKLFSGKNDTIFNTIVLNIDSQ